jgi:hypothetical protein
MPNNFTLPLINNQNQTPSINRNNSNGNQLQVNIKTPNNYFNQNFVNQQDLSKIKFKLKLTKNLIYIFY